MEGPQRLQAGIGLEVLVLDVGDDEARAVVVEGEGGRRRRRDDEVADAESAVLVPLDLEVHELVAALLRVGGEALQGVAGLFEVAPAGAAVVHLGGFVRSRLRRGRG